MGKTTGFLEFDRQENSEQEPMERIQHFNEFHKPLPKSKRQSQAARCMDCGVPFCQYGQVIAGSVSGCPLNNLIPEWNDFVYQDNYQQALKRLLKTNNFPEFTSRVCPALCEKACTCSLNGESVTTHDNEYAIIEEGYKQGWIQPRIPEHRTEKKIAIIGSGPAGLAVGDMLNQRGHHVTIFERDDRPGGLLMYGIPNMKLEKSVIERKINLMEQEGIIFNLNSSINTKKKADALRKEYDAIVLACGAKKPRDLNVNGRKGKGIYFAVDYLTAVTKSLLNSNLEDGSFPETKDKRVIVVGGGDTGNDCIGTAIRLHAKSVIQLEMMPEPPMERTEDNPWPEWPRVKKTDYGQAEAIACFGKDPRLYQTTVDSFVLDDNGQLVGANLVSLSFEEDPETHRSIMKVVEGSKRMVPCDIVLIAAGFVGCESDVCKAFGVDTSARGNVIAENFETTQENVFVAGDMHRGQSLVVYAIQEGRSCAYEIDKKLMGYSNM